MTVARLLPGASCGQAWNRRCDRAQPCGLLVRVGSYLPLKMGVIRYYHYWSAETNDKVATTDWVDGLVGVPDAA